MKAPQLILEFPKATVFFNFEEALHSTGDGLRVFVDGVYKHESNCGEQERAARAIVDAFLGVMIAQDLPHLHTVYAVQNLTECFNWRTRRTQVERDELWNAGVSYLGHGPGRLVSLVNVGIGPFKKHLADLIAIASAIVSMKRWYKSNKFEISMFLASVESKDVRQEMFNKMATDAFEVIYSEGQRMRLFHAGDWHMDYEHKITFSIKDPLNTPQNYNYERTLSVLFQLRNQELDVWLPPHVRSVLRENFDADVWHS